MGVNPGLFISKTATMKKKTLLFLSALLFFTLLLKQAEAQISFSIKIIPPEPYYERPLPPSVNHVWIDGEWVPEGDHYRHKPGYWTVPEKDHIWVRGEWKHNPRRQFLLAARLLETDPPYRRGKLDAGTLLPAPAQAITQAPLGGRGLDMAE